MRLIFVELVKWSRDGGVARALASHQCGRDSMPGLDVICRLSLLLVLVPGFFSGFSGFPSSTKTNISKSGTHGHLLNEFLELFGASWVNK